MKREWVPRGGKRRAGCRGLMYRQEGKVPTKAEGEGRARNVCAAAPPSPEDLAAFEFESR